MAERHYFAPLAWLGGWRRNVRLVVGADGHWSAIEPDSDPDADSLGHSVERLPGPVVPGLVNAHSHAFQRAIAGLTETRGSADDDFWSWRARMYRVALRISPDDLEIIATRLYRDLRTGGYTHVCEFQYLHNDPDGKPYAEPLAMSLALVRAAQAAGIGLTLLPTLYMRAGFDRGELGHDQRRFASTPDGVLRFAEAINGLGLARVNAGVALHSLRAVPDAALLEVAHHATRQGWPIHLHIAEQTREVDDCLAVHGRRPVEHLLQVLGDAGLSTDAGWNLVHTTHTTAPERVALAAQGARIVLCPSTEANLGDGLFDLADWITRGGGWSIGSDSHVTRAWPEELRWLEYGQRLQRRSRNVSATAAGIDSSGAALLQGALNGGLAASGLPLAGLTAGQRADFCVLDPAAAALEGVPDTALLDALIFSTPEARPLAVAVAGELVQAGPSPAASGSEDFKRVMARLWSG